MYAQIFRHIQLAAKWISLPFVIAGVALFVIQFLPNYIGEGILFYIFVGGSAVWLLDILWGTLRFNHEMTGQIRAHRHTSERAAIKISK